MNADELDDVRITIANEGFDYTFTGYSNFPEIKDEEFHKLRLAYLKAAKNLREYLNIED